MITRIKVKNFKSLDNFELSAITKFTCFIGLNGAGKTTLLQFLDFVRSLLLGHAKEWFAKHKWGVSDILTLGSNKKTIEFEFDISEEDKIKTWSARFNVNEMRCTYESMVIKNGQEEKQILIFEDNKLKVYNQNFPLPPGFRQEGSIFSFLKLMTDTPDVLLHTKVFGVLDPAEIAQATQTKSNIKNIEVESNGKGLVGFISRLSGENQNKLFRQLQNFYPSAQAYKIRNQHFGWKNLLLSELEKNYFDATHLSYGTLRLFVVLSQFYSENQCLIFDEIENGINQELFEKLLDILKDFNHKQIMITTHSALVLNYLSDEEARQNVRFLYKDKLGHTQARKFFDIPEVSQRLGLLGPGEVMIDTNLEKLSARLAGNSNNE